MSPNRFSIAIVALLIGFAANAGAQRNELSAIVGRTFISDQGVKGVPSFDTNLRFGNGLSFEANLARRLKGGEGIAALTVEIPVVYNRDEDIHYSVNVVPRQDRHFNRSFPIWRGPGRASLALAGRASPGTRFLFRCATP